MQQTQLLSQNTGGLDPEKAPFGNRGSYSNVQVYTLGLNITF